MPEASTVDLDRHDPRGRFPMFRVERRLCWGPISVDIVERAAGEVTSRSDCYRLTYFFDRFPGDV